MHWKLGKEEPQFSLRRVRQGNFSALIHCADQLSWGHSSEAGSEGNLGLGQDLSTTGNGPPFLSFSPNSLPWPTWTQPLRFQLCVQFHSQQSREVQSHHSLCVNYNQVSATKFLILLTMPHCLSHLEKIQWSI